MYVTFGVDTAMDLFPDDKSEVTIDLSSLEFAVFGLDKLVVQVSTTSWFHIPFTDEKAEKEKQHKVRGTLEKEVECVGTILLGGKGELTLKMDPMRPWEVEVKMILE